MTNIRFSVLSAVSLTVITTALPHVAKAQAKPGEPAVCRQLMIDYETVSKKLAYNRATGATDDSAPRETMRGTEDGNALEKARMAFDIMKSNGCKLPTFTPSASRYSAAGLTCSTDLQRRRAELAYDRFNRVYVDRPYPASCDLSAWKPND